MFVFNISMKATAQMATEKNHYDSPRQRGGRACFFLLNLGSPGSKKPLSNSSARLNKRRVVLTDQTNKAAPCYGEGFIGSM